MAKKITNNVEKQIAHFQQVWGSYWREYTVAELWGDQVYISESLMRGQSDVLQKFVIAHEIGHWVTKEDLLVPGNAMESEIKADEFAMSVYGHEKEVVDAARNALMETMDLGILKLRAFNHLTPPKDIWQLADRMAVLSERIKRLK